MKTHRWETGEEINEAMMVYAAKFVLNCCSEPGSRGIRHLRQMLQNLSIFPKKEWLSTGDCLNLILSENAEMLLLMSGLVGPLTSEELQPL